MVTKSLPMLLVATVTLITMAACPTDDDGQSDPSDAGGDYNGQADTDRPDGESDIPTGPVTDDFIISYVTRTRVPPTPEEEYWRMWVTDSDCTWQRCTTTEVTGGSFSCKADCALSRDLQWALWFDPNAPGSLMIAPLDSSYQVGTARLISNNVEAWQLGPEKIVYQRSGVLYAQNLSGGAETELLTIYGEGQLPGGFHYAPQIDRVIANIPSSLSSAYLVDLSVSNPADQRVLYHLVSDIEGYPGSFYQGNLHMSVSPDGEYLAIFTQAWHMTTPCGDGSACSDSEYTCSTLNAENPRCRGEMILLQVIKLSEADLLTTSENRVGCSSNTQCGTHGVCDTDAVHETEPGVCIPINRVLGPYRQSPCRAPAGATIQLGEYNRIIDPPMWRGDGSIVFGAQNTCGTQGIRVSDLLAFDNRLQSVQPILQQPATSAHGGAECYDEVEEVWTPGGCVIEITRTRTSPSGNSLVFIGSSVRSTNDAEAWRISAYGGQQKIYMSHDILNQVISVGAHQPR